MFLLPINHIQYFHSSKITCMHHIIAVKSSPNGTLYLNTLYNHPHLASAYNCSSFSHYLHQISSIWNITQNTIFAKKPSLMSFLHRYIWVFWKWRLGAMVKFSEVTSLSHENRLLQKCKLRLHTLDPQMGLTLFQTPCIAETSYSRLRFYIQVSCYCSNAIRRPVGPPSRSLRKRMRKRALTASKPSLDEAQFQRVISQLPPRFTAEELHNAIVLQEDPLMCLELFNWASKQHRFRHNELTYHVTIKKLGLAKMYEEMDDVVNQVLAVPLIGSEALYNTMIYYFTEARKLTRTVNLFKHMRNSKKLDCRPSIRTYNLLFAALLGRGKNSYINHMYMETIRCLFKQMVDDGIEPDIFSLNSMIKGYVLSLHVNDALRIYHQMGVVYRCLPNSFSYDYLIHGLCAQERTNNARELCDEMKKKGFIPSSKSYNSIVNALALGGEVDEAVMFLREMSEYRRPVDFITYQTVIDEICRQRRVKDARCLLEELLEKDLVDGHTYTKLLDQLEDNFPNLNSRY